MNKYERSMKSEFWQLYWKHALSRCKLRGKHLTWLLYVDYGWLRIYNFIIRWPDIKIEHIRQK